LATPGRRQAPSGSADGIGIDVDRDLDPAATGERPVAVEVVSTNWEDDYIDKLDEYQRLGIPEFWILDYLAMGSRDLLGRPKEPTLFIGTLTNQNTYRLTPYRGDQAVQSPTFPELRLTMQQILAA